MLPHSSPQDSLSPERLLYCHEKTPSPSTACSLYHHAKIPSPSTTRLLRLCVWGDSRLGRLPMGRLLMHLLALACIALSCFSIFPDSSRQCYLFVSLESTKRLWCSVHLTWWHSGRSDIRGFPCRVLLGIAASRYSNIYQCSQHTLFRSFITV
jgi:hypothetical protein